MCNAKPEWKDMRGNNRWTQEYRGRANEVYRAVDAARAQKLADYNADMSGKSASDFKEAYQDEYADELQSAYDAAVRGIAQGFIRKGIFKQGDYDTQKSALDTAHTGADGQTGQGRLNALAQAYANDAQSHIATERTRLTGELDRLQREAETPKDTSGLTWSSGNRREKNPYYNDVWQDRVDQMKTLDYSPVTGVSGHGAAPVFLQDWEQLALGESASPAATRSASRSPARSARRTTMADSMGVRTPYSQKSQRLIG